MRKWDILDRLIEIYGAEYVLQEFMQYVSDKEMNQLIDWFIVTVVDNDEGVEL